MNATKLKQDVEQLLIEVDKTHRYSMSKIYSLSNDVFGKNEMPQSCASCLIRKVRELRKWFQSQVEEKTEIVSTVKTKRKSKSRKAE